MVEVGAVKIDGPLLDHDARDQRDETRVDGLSKVEGGALVTRFPIIEPGNPDYQTRDMLHQLAGTLLSKSSLRSYRRLGMELLQINDRNVIAVHENP
jgi:hypothetical protein